jgi:hypothetical protein
VKLAEALAERSDCQNRIEEMKKRLIRSARVQEGEQPAEDTTELLAETERTNSKTGFDNERSISDAIGKPVSSAGEAVRGDPTRTSWQPDFR